MRLALVLALFVSLVTPTFAQTPPPEFPDTGPGRHARDFFQAFDADEPEMRAFWTAHGSAAALARRPIEPRLQVWRQMRGEHGLLTPLTVTQSREDFIEVRARTQRQGDIRIGFLCEPDGDHGLVSLRVEPADDPDAAPQIDATTPGNTPTEVLSPGPPPTDEQVVNAFNATLDSLARNGKFWGTAVLAKGNSLVTSRTYGPASRIPRRDNTADTRFNLGSLNKIITHTAILQLDQSGKLSLGDPVTKWLPDYTVANANKITLQMLLDHRGGVPDVLENPDLERDQDRVRSNGDWYRYVRTMPLRFEPGTKQEYSNGGFVLLGQVIAKASGEDYYDYVRRHIYAPAKMTRTEHLAANEKLEERAVGYTTEFMRGAGADTSGGLSPNTTMLPGRGSAAGGGYSTVGDLVRFANALRSHRLLDAAHVEQLVGPQVSLGIAGGSPGCNGMLMMAGPYTLVLLSNLDPPAAEQVAPGLGALVRRAAGLQPPARRPVGGGR